MTVEQLEEGGLRRDAHEGVGEEEVRDEEKMLRMLLRDLWRRPRGVTAEDGGEDSSSSPDHRSFVFRNATGLWVELTGRMKAGKDPDYGERTQPARQLKSFVRITQEMVFFLGYSSSEAMVIPPGKSQKWNFLGK